MSNLHEQKGSFWQASYGAMVMNAMMQALFSDDELISSDDNAPYLTPNIIQQCFDEHQNEVKRLPWSL